MYSVRKTLINLIFTMKMHLCLCFTFIPTAPSKAHALLHMLLKTVYLAFRFVCSLITLSSLISRHAHQLLAIRRVLFSFSLGGFLAKELTASLWLWACYVSSPTFSPYPSFPVMSLSLAYLDLFSNLSRLNLSWIENV